jgi:hypothetical protein
LRGEDAREDWQAKKDEWREAHKNWLESRPENRLEMRKNMAKVFFGRFNFAATVLQNMHDRIEAWLEKVDDEIDGGAARTALSNAQAKIDAIKTKNTEIRDILDNEVTSENKEAKKAEVKSKLEEAKTLIKEAHQFLKDAFRSIKEELSTAREESDNEDGDDDSDDDDNDDDNN